MKRTYTLIVTDTSPLITLALAGELDYEFVAEKRAGIEAWGKWLTRITADAAANDVALRAVVP